jgi:manganese efflux pump family protein
VTSFLALLAAAIAVGLGNFGAAIGLGVSGVDRATRIRVGLTFAVFESGMPLVGLAVGQGLAGSIGDAGQWVGGGLLIATGLYTLWSAYREDDDDSETPKSSGMGRLLVTALALSIDNLVVGFSLGVQHVNLLEALVVFAVVSAGLALLGLEFGRRLGHRIEIGGDYLAGGVLVVVGILVATGLI